MNSLLFASRVVHLASAILLFGELVFVVAVARPWREFARAGPRHDCERRLLLVTSWSLAASIVSGAAWLAAEAAVMSGLPFEQAIGRDTLGLVFTQTAFGRLWMWRLGLAVALGALLLALARANAGEHKSRIAAGAFVAAAAYLAMLAWAGHAAAGQGSERYIQLFSDVVHLLAAGAWLGALPGLVTQLKRAQPLEAAAQTTRRFSALGVASVSALILTGSANTWYLVGDVPALFGTVYGRLLTAKLALVAAMVGLALVNRLHLTPRLEARQPQALRSLRRNAILEAAAGVAVVAIVGALGITIPAAHQSPVWPFDHTLSLQPAQESSAIRMALVAVAMLAGIGGAVVLASDRRRSARLWAGGLIAVVTAAGASGWLLAVPAYPTTYSASPVPYSVDAIARGASLYGERCGGCHGADGHGDGPIASTLPIRPPNLAEHALHHRPGNLFWWIAHGIPGAPMPGFAPQLRTIDIWNLVQFLHAQADAKQALAITGGVEPHRAIVAPDFTFELNGQPQETLKGQRGDFITLLVFYSLPQSLPRLRALATDLPAFTAARARVIAVPRGDSATAAIVEESASLFALTGPNTAVVYAMFAPESVGASKSVPAHVELLIDRQGYMRARWIDVPAAAPDRTAEVLAQIELLNDEQSRAAPQETHAH